MLSSGFNNPLEDVHRGLSGLSITGPLTLEPEYETVKMLDIPSSARWAGLLPPGERVVALKSYGHYFVVAKDMRVSGIGLDSRTSDGLLTPCAVRIIQEEKSEFTTIVSTTIDRSALFSGLDYKKILATPIVLLPGNYYVVFDLFDNNNLLNLKFITNPSVIRPSLLPLDPRVSTHLASLLVVGYGVTTLLQSTVQSAIGMPGTSPSKTQTMGPSIYSYCGFLYVDIMKRDSILSCHRVECDEVSGHENLSWTGGLYIQSHTLFLSDTPTVVRYTPGSLIDKGYGSLAIRSVRPGDVYSIEYSVIASSVCTVDVYISGRRINSNTIDAAKVGVVCTHRFEFTPSVGTIDIVTDSTSKIGMEEFRVVKVF